jgi:hypothetical protein
MKEATMKPLFWVGLIVLVLGIFSLVVPIPRTERHGFSAGDVSVGVTTKHDEKVSPVISAGLILAGAGLMIAGKGRA